MSWFGPTRNPEDPHQLRIAVHELGHAWAWQAGGLQIRSVTHTGSDGDCHVRYYPTPEQLHAFAVGCWAGYEAEDRWLRTHRRGRASRGNASHDLREFRGAVRELRELGITLTETQARAQARTLITRHWTQITRTAPDLIRRGRITL